MGDVFSIIDYLNIIIGSFLNYCHKKDLLIHAFSIIPNQFHFIVSAINNNLLDIIMYFNKFTLAKIIKAIKKILKNAE